MKRLEEIAALMEIQDVIGRYCLSLDLRDMDAFLELLTEDIEFRTHDGPLYTGKQAVRDFVLDTWKSGAPSRHVASAAIAIAMNGAHAASSVHHGYWEHPVDGQLVVAGLTYSIDYRHEMGNWRMSRRHAEIWYSCCAGRIDQGETFGWGAGGPVGTSAAAWRKRATHAAVSE